MDGQQLASQAGDLIAKQIQAADKIVGELIETMDSDSSFILEKPDLLAAILEYIALGKRIVSIARQYFADRNNPLIDFIEGPDLPDDEG